MDSAVFALTSIVTEGGLIVTAGDSSGHLISWEVKTRKKLWGTGRGGDLNQPQALHRRVVEPIGPVTAAQLHRLSDALVCVVAIHEDRVRLLNAGDGSVITAADPTISPLGPRFAPQLAVTFGDEGEYVVAVVARDQLGYYPFTVKGEGSSWTLARHELVGLAIQIVAIRPHPSVRSTFRVLTSDGEIIESNPMVVAGLPPRGTTNGAQGVTDKLDRNRAITTGDLASPATALAHAHVDPDTGLLTIVTISGGKRSSVYGSHGEKPSALTIVESAERRPLVATGASDRTVRVWDPYSAPADAKIVSPVMHVHSLPGGDRETFAMAVRKDGSVEFLNGMNAQPVQSAHLGSPATNVAGSTGHPGRGIIVVGTMSGGVHLWRQNGLANPAKLTPLPLLGAGVKVDVDPSGRLVATVDLEGNVVLWELGNRNRVLLEQVLQDASQGPIAVKVHQPYDDLTVIVVLTEELVQVVRLEGGGRRQRVEILKESHGLPYSNVYSPYVRGKGLGLLAGATDGQTLAIQEFWTPGGSLNLGARSAISGLNLQQPVTALQAFQIGTVPLLMTACGAYGRIKTVQMHNPANARTIELGQPVIAAHTHAPGQLLVAVLGGTALLDLAGENALLKDPKPGV